jgi:large subunit ribosomal protein L28
MAKCEICGKAVQFGHSVSHSNRKTQKIWRPNIQKIKVLENGRKVRKYLCARCIRSNKVAKAI